LRTFLLISALVVALTGQAYAEPRDHAGFTRVEASGDVQVEVSLGAAHAVDVSGPGSSGVQTHMRGDVLVITDPTQSGLTTEGVLVRVTSPQLVGARAVNGARMSVEGLADADLTLEALAAGKLTVGGRCRTLLAAAHSAGGIDASALTCEDARVRAASGSQIRVTIARWVEVDASSGAQVFSLGTPTYGKVAVSSGGQLHRGLRDGG
jgi:hypothetical protein